MSSLASKFGGFLAKHSSDLHNVAGALSALAAAIPVNAGDRERLNTAIGKVTTAADNIAASVESVTTTTTDPETGKSTPTIDKGAVEGILASMLPGLLEDALAAHFAKHPVTAPAPVVAAGTPGPVAKLTGELAQRDQSSEGADKAMQGDQQPKGDGSGSTITA